MQPTETISDQLNMYLSIATGPKEKNEYRSSSGSSLSTYVGGKNEPKDIIVSISNIISKILQRNFRPHQHG